MIDEEKREKVIRGLKAHCKAWDTIDCIKDPDICPYRRGDKPGCTTALAADALALLKEQEEGIEPKARTQEQEDFAEKLGIIAPAWWCGVCGFQLLQYGLKYCPNCGKRVKWDD